VRVLVLGAGAYVTGRGTEGLGTVLPALAQHSKSAPIEEVTIRATRESNASLVHKAAEQINHRLGSRLQVRYETSTGPRGSDAGYDCAIVVVPDEQHFATCSSLIRVGLHCLVVKPFTPSLEEATRLLSLQREHGVHAAVEFHKRLDPQNRVVKRLLDEGRIGTPSHASVAYSQRTEVPSELFRHWSEQTNIFQYLGVHYVDLLHFLTGYLPERAMAIGSRGVLVERGLDLDDAILATVEWRSPERPQRRFVSSFTVGWIDPSLSTAESDQRYSIVGSTGRIDCDQKHRGLELVTDHDRVRSINPHFSEYLGSQDAACDFAGYGADSIRAFLDDVAAIRRGKLRWQELVGCRPSFQQALVSTAVLEAVSQSLASRNAWIAVPAVLGSESHALAR